MRDRRTAGDKEGIGGSAKEPCERDLHRCAADALATLDKIDDCSGLKPPSGKKGTQAMPSRVRSSIRASSVRWARLYIPTGRNRSL